MKPFLLIFVFALFHQDSSANDHKMGLRKALGWDQESRDSKRLHKALGDPAKRTAIEEEIAEREKLEALRAEEAALVAGSKASMRRMKEIDQFYTELSKSKRCRILRRANFELDPQRNFLPDYRAFTLRRQSAQASESEDDGYTAFYLVPIRGLKEIESEKIDLSDRNRTKWCQEHSGMMPEIKHYDYDPISGTFEILAGCHPNFVAFKALCKKTLK